jgi:hypothetical protein
LLASPSRLQLRVLRAARAKSAAATRPEAAAVDVDVEAVQLAVDVA